MAIEQASLLASAALGARSRRALALVRALRAIARNHGHAEHAMAVDTDLAAGDAVRLLRDERAWHDASIRAYGLLLECLQIAPNADESDDAEDAFQEALTEIFGGDEGSEGDDV